MLNLTKDNFNKEVLENNELVVVDFWADWCGPCKALGPRLEEFANENPSIKVCKVNIDNEPELASQFRVMSIPTLLVFKYGEIVNKSVGLISKEEIEALIK